MRLSTCTEWLFFHLWRKNLETGQSCQKIRLADTVIYRWAKPFFRYYTSSSGQIIRKTKERIDIEQVENAYMSQNQLASAFIITSDQKKGNKEIISFEYFNNDQFTHFLHQREKDLNSVLQKFIMPKGNRNTMIKVQWTPQFCILLRRTNAYNINNTQRQIIEKICTFEGLEYQAEQENISSPILTSELEQMCINIAQHIQIVSGGNIQVLRMVLYFKIDEQNRIWLLFCTSLKTKDRNIQEESARVESPLMRVIDGHEDPKEGDQHFTIKNNLSNQQNQNICSNCDCFSHQLYPVEFRIIIQSFQKAQQLYINILKGLIKKDFTRLPQDLQKIRDKVDQDQQQKQKKQNIIQSQNNVHNHKITLEEIKVLLEVLDEEQDDLKLNLDIIPALIVKVWGRITEEKYKLLQINPSWLNLKTNTCLNCFMKITSIYDESKLEREVSLKVLKKNKQQQQPKILIKKPSLQLKNQLNIKATDRLPPVQQESQISNFNSLQIQNISNQPSTINICQSQQVEQIKTDLNPYLINRMIQGRVKDRKNRPENIYGSKQGLRQQNFVSTSSLQSQQTKISRGEQSRTNKQGSFDRLLTTVSELKQRWIQIHQEELL